MFCNNCGASIDDNSRFCLHCGQQIDMSNLSINENMNGNNFEEEGNGYVMPEENNQQYNGQYNAQYSEEYNEQQGNNINDNKSGFITNLSYEPISMWGYFGYEILFAIPIVGFILIIIFSITANNINVRNFARAYLVTYVLGVILLLIIYITIVGNNFRYY